MSVRFADLKPGVWYWIDGSDPALEGFLHIAKCMAASPDSAVLYLPYRRRSSSFNPLDIRVIGEVAPRWWQLWRWPHFFPAIAVSAPIWAPILVAIAILLCGGGR